jgi:hypothetical protein
MKKYLLVFLLSCTRAFGQIAGNKWSTCIEFTQADVPVTASPVTLTARASSGVPVTFTSKSPAVCTVAGGVASLKLAGVCTLVAKSAATPAYMGGQTPLSFNVTAVLGPPPIDSGVRSATLLVPASVVVDKTFLVLAETQGNVNWVDFYVDGVKLSRSTSAPYYINYLAAVVGKIKFSIEASITGANGAGYFAAEQLVEVMKEGGAGTGGGGPPPPTKEQLFFMGCGSCPSTGKIEATPAACTGWVIGKIDAMGGDVAANFKWVKL